MSKKLLMVLMGIFLLVGCGTEEEIEERIQPVMVEEVTKAPNELDFEYPGVIISDKDTLVSFRIIGPIIEMDVEVGDFFKKGDVIAKMDTRDYLLSLSLAEKKIDATKNIYEASQAISENSRNQHERVKKLYDQNSISKKDYDNSLALMKTTASNELAALSQYEASIEAKKYAENMLLDTELKAPFDGYVNTRFVDEGSQAIPGSPVVAMSSNKNSKVKINVSEEDIEKLEHLSKAVFINNEATYNLKVNSISKVKGIGQIAYPVTFDLEDDFDKELLIDSEGKLILTFENPKKGETIISSNALFGEGNKMMVWVCKDGIISEKEVTNVSPYKDGEVIVSGLASGETIVTKGVNQLYEGQKVKILN